MDKNYFLSGAWNVTCDVCSKKIKASDAKQRWDGLIVCPSDFEHRHEQDYVKARTDKITVPFTRPVPELTFTFVCTHYTSQGRADMGEADCARADIIADPADYCTITGSTATPGYATVGCAVTGKILQGQL